MKKYLMFACAALLLASCEKPYSADADDTVEPGVAPGDGDYV